MGLLHAQICTSMRNVVRQNSSDNNNTLFKVLKHVQTSLTTFPKTLAMEISGHLTPFLAEKKNSLEKLLVGSYFSVCFNNI
jgi:hypothetical protein